MVGRVVGKIENLRSYQIAAIIAALGFFIFGRSLTNGFVGDDLSQIVNNPVTQSMHNLPLFFQGGTFYVDGGIAPLEGIYYRPIMTTTFSLIYSIFGNHAFYFHFIQLLLHIGCVVLVFLLLKLSVRRIAAFIGALVFLIHPINTQSVYALASTQEVLMAFFGLLALWILVNYRSTKSTLLVAGLLLLALLSKESGIIFVFLGLALLAMWDRSRLKLFFGLSGLVIAIWFTMRVAAVGFFTNAHNAPITELSFIQRLFTTPSIFFHYIERFIAPINLSAMYYWTVPHFSFGKVFLPILGILILLLFLFSVIDHLYEKVSKTVCYDFSFYVLWFALSFGIISQVHALDMTASDAWFYTPSIGIIGMLTIGLSRGLSTKTWQKYSTVIAIALFSVFIALSTRTFIRGFDWKDDITLASHDIKTSKNSQDNFNYAYTLGLNSFDQHDYVSAEEYAQRSVQGHEMTKNTFLLGKARYLQGNYKDAYSSFLVSLKHQPTPTTYEYMALCLLHTGDMVSNRTFYESATKAYPTVGNLWQIWAVYEYKENNPTEAKELITKARQVDPYNQQIKSIYVTITSDQPLAID